MQFLILLGIGFCQCYHLNMTTDRKKIGSLTVGENEITDYDASKTELQISTRSDNYKPLESLDLFEGDILNVNLQDLIGSEIDERTLSENATKTWENGIVPYEISSDFESEEKDIIVQAIGQYHKHTCLKFILRLKDENDYIYIQPGKSGCSSSVGFQGGKQEVNLGKGCLVIGIVQHELMHAIGFWHEQSRPDRDEFITIKWSNIQKEKELNFLKHSWNLLDLLTMSYDITSLMHYGPFAFAKNPKQPTITVNTGDVTNMGQREHFSDIDIEKINKLYKCENIFM